MFYLTAIIAGISNLPSAASGAFFHNFVQSRFLAIQNACEVLKNEAETLKLSSINDDAMIKIVIAPEYFFTPFPEPKFGQEQRQSSDVRYLNHAQFLIIRSKLLNISKQYPDILIIPGTISYKKGTPHHNPTGDPNLTPQENACENILSLCLKTAQNMRFGISDWLSLENLLDQLKTALNQLPVDEAKNSISLQELSAQPSPAFTRIQDRRRRYHNPLPPIPHVTMDTGAYPQYTQDQQTSDRLAAYLNTKSVNLTNVANPITYRNSVIAYWDNKIAYNGTKNLGYKELDPKLLWTNAQLLYGYTPKNKGFAWQANNIFKIKDTMFGVEICYDHYHGILKKQLTDSAATLDVQIILSDSVINYTNNRIAEFCIHASSDFTNTGVEHKSPQQGETKFLHVKWIQFTYLDLMAKFSKKIPSQTFATNEKYSVLLTRSCNNLPANCVEPPCAALGNRYSLSIFYDHWNRILPEPSGELIFSLQGF